MNYFLLFITAFGTASALIGDEFFSRYVNKYLNHSVSPCDNFYRHVCPRDMETSERPAGSGGVEDQIISEWIKEGARKLEQKRNYTHFERVLLQFSEGNELIVAYDNLAEDVKTDVISRGFEAAYVYLSMIERMQSLMAGPDIHMFAPRRLMHEIIEMAEKEIEVSNLLYNPRTIERFRNSLATLNTEYYDEYKETVYEKIFSDLDQFFLATGALDRFNESNVKDNFEDFLETMGIYALGLMNLEPVAPSVMFLPGRIMSMNAYYQPNGNYLYFYDAILLLSINASTPAKYGRAGSVMAHEMFHSILNASEWTNDSKLGQHSACLASHMTAVCRQFQEGDCSSGSLTYNEDAPDMEAVQLMFKMMKNKMGDQLKQLVDGTRVTNEQMFFYANAMFNCDPEDDDGSINHGKDFDSPSGWEGHSMGIPRVNGPLSLMNAFHEAFDCKAGDRMFDIAVGREDCNAIGHPVRK